MRPAAPGGIGAQAREVGFITGRTTAPAMTDERSYATMICCMDGRIHGPLVEWIRKRAGVNYVDAVTEPGADKMLSHSPDVAEQLRKKARGSIRARGSKLLVVAGHAGCAGNPVSEEQHRKDVADSVKIVQGWDTGIDVAGVWVSDDRVVHPV